MKEHGAAICKAKVVVWCSRDGRCTSLAQNVADQLLNAETGDLIGDVHHESSDVDSLVLSANGKLATSRAWDKITHVWAAEPASSDGLSKNDDETLGCRLCEATSMSFTAGRRSRRGTPSDVSR